MPAVIGISNLPNQRHKIASRKVQDFTILVVGQGGLGKTTFINTLFGTQIVQRRENLTEKLNIQISNVACQENGFQVRLNIVDCKGYGDYVDNQNCWIPISQYIDQQFRDYLIAEKKPFRQGIIDNRVHVCLYFLEPTGHTLKSIDVQVMKLLGGRVNLIPIIAKADTLTVDDLLAFKKRIRECILENEIQVYLPTVLEDDDGTTKSIRDAMPFSVIGSTATVTVAGKKVIGRQYIWGVAEVENEAHCDFVKLRNLLIKTHMDDLLSSAQDHYEDYRSRMLSEGGERDDAPDILSKKALEIKIKEDEDLLRKRFTEQVRKEELRFKAWEQQLIGERDRLNKELEAQHAAVKALEEELEAIYQSTKA